MKKLDRATARKRAEELLKKMTLAEKVGQLNQKLMGFNCYEWNEDGVTFTEEFCQEVEKCSGLGVLYGLYRADPWSARDYENGLYGERAIRAYNQVQKYVIEHSRLGIPVLMSTECPHGHQALDGYLLPVNLAAGAAFDPELYEKACGVCARQLNDMGVHLALVSMLDMLRDPRWGRSEECYGEDPVLSSKMAAAGVRGFQNEGVTVIAKHFAAQGETTGGINASAARIGERELREIHLPAAKACCEEHVGGVMAAYNEIDGVYCHANAHLLRDILRGEMGFDGMVMADGVAVDNLAALTGDKVKAGALALRSGVNVSLWDQGFSRLEEAVSLGYVTEEEVDEAALIVLTEKYAQGLFDNPYLPEGSSKAYTVEEHPETLQMAQESVILLKNEDSILPLSGNEKIALIGPEGNEIYNLLGDYSPALKKGDGITIAEGMRQCLEQSGRSGQVTWYPGSNILSGTEEELEAAVQAAKESDVVVLAIGGSSSRFGKVSFDVNGAAKAGSEVTMDCGEGVDCCTLEVSPAQRALARAVYATGKPVITVIVSGRPMLIGEDKEQAKALVQSFYPGPAGGLAIAQVLFGDVNPSGLLPASIPSAAGQLPVYYNMKESFPIWKYYDGHNAPLYPFGYGMSYTNFTCEGVKRDKDTVLLSEVNQEDAKKPVVSFDVTVKNDGDRDGDAVVLLYIHDEEASTVRRIREMKAFQRTSLKAGETKEVTLNLLAEDLRIWDAGMNWTGEPGTVEITIEIMGNAIYKENIKVK